MIFNKKISNEWVVEFNCISCHKVLEEKDRLYLHGICCHCGHNSNSTICNTTKNSVKHISYISCTTKFPFIKLVKKKFYR